MFLVRFLFIITLMWSASVFAVPIMQVENKTLVGVKNVIVGKQEYDVSFKFGTCAQVFNGCSSFPFKLREKHQIDYYANFFDALRSLHKAIYGSDDPNAVAPSAFYVPELKIPTNTWYGLANEETWHVSYARFFNFYDSGEYSVEFDVLDSTNLWTVWSAPRRVPEPSSLSLLSIMLLGVILIRRFKKY